MLRRHSSQLCALLLVLGLLYWALEGGTDSAKAPPNPPDELTAERPARVVHGRVDYVFDGDTISLETPERRWKVRLAGIDSPERDQPHSEASREYLSQRCAGRQVDVVVAGYDRYHRLLGDIYLDHVWINGELVAAGYAWAWSRGQRAAELEALQREAKKSRRGLWSAPRPVPPWQHRRNATSGGQAPAQPP